MKGYIFLLLYFYASFSLALDVEKISSEMAEELFYSETLKIYAGNGFDVKVVLKRKNIECLYDDKRSMCKTDRLAILICDEHVNSFLIGYQTTTEYEWLLDSINTEKEVVLINAKKRIYDEEEDDMKYVSIVLRFDARTGSGISVD